MDIFSHVLCVISGVILQIGNCNLCIMDQTDWWGCEELLNKHCKYFEIY